MKIARLLITALFVFGSLGLIQAQTFIAHEWGTFTTLSGSDGKLLPGLYLEEEQLPGFLHSQTGFAPDPGSQKGIFKPCYNATVKMETPVLYFYCADSLRVKANVDFPAGTISQWFPQRSGGEVANADTAFDFSKPYKGSIKWDFKILEPGNKTAYSGDKSMETNTWIAPRATDANLVTSNNETEKFLFYRGVGNFSLPIKTEIIKSELIITNSLPDTLPLCFVFERRPNDSFYCHYSDRLYPSRSKNVKLHTRGMDSIGFDGFMYLIKDKLVRSGLFQKEADAMVNTWWHSYFGTHGLKVFWIVPKRITDSLLPLSLNPAPKSIARVMIGRSEVLTPEFEKQLVADFSSGKSYIYKSDRYYLAYLSRYNALASTGLNEIVNYKPVPVLTVYPNPIAKRFAVDLVLSAPSTVKLQVITLTGAIKLNLPPQKTDGVFHQELDLDQFPSGVYIIKAEVSGQQFIERIFKD